MAIFIASRRFKIPGPIYAQRKLVAAARIHVVRIAKHVRLMRYGRSTVVVASTWRELQTNKA